MTPSQFKKWRKHMKLSQDKAAVALGVGATTIRHYENGYRSSADHKPAEIPRAVELACVALALGISKYEGPN